MSNSVVSTLKNPAFVVAVGLLTASSIAMSAAITYFKIYLNKEAIYPEGGRQLNAIPAESESYVRIGADTRMPKDIEDVLGTTNYISRYYRLKNTPEGAPPEYIQFHAAYYTGMIDTVPHVPDRCMVGAGLRQVGPITEVPIPMDQNRWKEDPWVPDHLKGRIFTMRTGNNPPDLIGQVKYTDSPLLPVRLPRDPGNIKLRAMKFEEADGKKPRWAGYFFIANGGTVSRAEDVRLMAFDLSATYSYYLKVEFQSDSVSSAEELAAKAGKFLDEFFPEVMRCVPDWVKVDTGEYPPDNPLGKGSPEALEKGKAE